MVFLPKNKDVMAFYLFAPSVHAGPLARLPEPARVCGAAWHPGPGTGETRHPAGGRTGKLKEKQERCKKKQIEIAGLRKQLRMGDLRYAHLQLLVLDRIYLWL
jgi:hypothetical protein